MPGTEKPPPESFAGYLAKRFIGEKRFRSGAPEEAAELVKKSDIVLTHSDLGLAIVCIVDREGDSKKRFAFSQQETLDIGRSCLKYTGTVNGAKMPVGITLYEIADGPPSEDDRARLKALQKSFPGFAKVAISCFYLDLRSKTVWSTAPLNGLLRGGSVPNELRALDLCD